MAKVYKYWCEPATSADTAALCNFIRLAADYRRELARIENRARDLLRRQPDDATRALIYEQQGIASRAARARAVDGGLHWGSYQNADEAHSDSCRSTKIYDNVRTFVPRDVGCAAVHLQPARTLGEAEDWIRIGGIVRKGSELNKSGQVRPARHRAVTLRIGTTPEKAPLRVNLFVRLHREMPDGAVVSWARVHRRRLGSKFRWELHFTFADVRATPAPQNRAKAVGVDIGWRKLEGCTRIAYWWGSDGREGQVTISDFVLGGDAKSDSLRAIRDEAKNVFRKKLCTWVAAIPDRSTWIVEECTFAHAWLKTWRFVRMAHRWRDERIAGDEQIFEEMAAWLKQDRHLWDWEAAGREKRQRRVGEIIRVLAVNLARQYDRVGIESPMVAALVKKVARCEACAKLPKRCDACYQAERLRKLASGRVPHAAPARTRMEIKTFGAKYGALVLEMDPAYTTMDCAACGWRRDDVTDWASLQVGCSGCGVVEDQDRTAAKNLARLASDAILGEDGKPLAPGKTARSSKKLGARRTRKVVRPDRSLVPA